MASQPKLNEKSLQSNKSDFRAKTIPILIVGFFLLYFYSGLQNDHLNVLIPYYSQLGWDAVTITNPVTYAGFAVIIATFFVGTLLIRFGVKQVLVPSIIILALSAFGLGAAGTNALLYNVSLFTMRLFVVPLVMGCFMLCTNWFIKQRGRALGIVAAGHQMCTATLIAGLTGIVSTYSFQAAYSVVGVVLIGIAVYTAIAVKSTPEECGLFPDGEAASMTKPVERQMTIGEVFANKNSWLLVISFGLLQFAIVGVMAFYVPRLSMVGTDPAIYLLWLSISAFVGIPLAYLMGVIDDKYGTVTAAVVLSCFYLLALVFLLIMQPNNVMMIIGAALGIAGMTGGTSVIHPSITAYVYGRENYQAANRWIMALQAFIMAFAIFYMSKILDATHSLNLGYVGMIVMVIIAIICFLLIGRSSDFDRGDVSKQ